MTRLCGLCCYLIQVWCCHTSRVCQRRDVWNMRRPHLLCRVPYPCRVYILLAPPEEQTAIYLPNEYMGHLGRSVNVDPAWGAYPPPLISTWSEQTPTRESRWRKWQSNSDWLPTEISNRRSAKHVLQLSLAYYVGEYGLGWFFSLIYINATVVG